MDLFPQITFLYSKPRQVKVEFVKIKRTILSDFDKIMLPLKCLIYSPIVNAESTK